jgi:hypothetical protein
MADHQADTNNNPVSEYSDEDVEVVDPTKMAVQHALNRAREHRDTTLTDHKSGSRGSRGSRGTSRPQVYYNPDNDAPDTRSTATTTVSMAGEYLDENGRPMRVVAIPKGAKIKTVGDDDSDDGEEFDALTYDEIQINLRLMGDLVQDEKIHISSDRKTMVVDNRYDLMGARRAWSGDSRTKTLRFIKHVYAQTEALCNDIVDKVKSNSSPKENTEKLINLYGLIQASAKGLDRLNMTYATDKLCSAKIATIKKGYETYCDQTLKKTIDGFKNYVE